MLPCYALPLHVSCKVRVFDVRSNLCQISLFVNFAGRRTEPTQNPYQQRATGGERLLLGAERPLLDAENPELQVVAFRLNGDRTQLRGAAPLLCADGLQHNPVAPQHYSGPPPLSAKALLLHGHPP